MAQQSLSAVYRENVGRRGSGYRAVVSVGALGPGNAVNRGQRLTQGPSEKGRKATAALSPTSWRGA